MCPPLRRVVDWFVRCWNPCFRLRQRKDNKNSSLRVISNNIMQFLRFAKWRYCNMLAIGTECQLPSEKELVPWHRRQLKILELRHLVLQAGRAVHRRASPVRPPPRLSLGRQSRHGSVARQRHRAQLKEFFRAQQTAPRQFHNWENIKTLRCRPPTPKTVDFST